MSPRVVLALTRRELSAAFGQPAAWVFVAAALWLSAALGLTGFFERGVADLRDHAFQMRLALLLLAPALAMRAWAEERASGTIELLFALPVRPVEAVLAKFLAAFAVLALAVLLGLALPLSLLPSADLDAGQVLTGALGALLVGALYLAAGLCASALSRSQVVAFVLAALGGGVLVAIGEPLALRELGRLAPPGLVSALAELGVGRHLEPLGRGIVDTADLAYFAAFTALLLGANVLAVERPGPRGERAAALGLGVALALLVGSLAAQPALRGRTDATVRAANTLAPETRELLQRLDGPLLVRAYLPDELPPGYEAVRPTLRHLVDVLEAVRDAAPAGRVVLEVEDPLSTSKEAEERQALQERAEREGVTPVTLTLPREGRTETIRVYCGVALLFAGRPPVTLPAAVDRTRLEHDLAVALRRLTSPRQRIGLVGDGLDDYGLARAALGLGDVVEPLDLEGLGRVPDGIDLLLVAAPVPPRGVTLVALDRFLHRGGRALLLLDAHAVDGDRWFAEPFENKTLLAALSRWGVVVRPGALLGPARTTLQHTIKGEAIEAPVPWFVEVEHRDDPDGGLLPEGLGSALLVVASPLAPAPTLPPGVTFTPLLRGPPCVVVEDGVDLHPLRLPAPPDAPSPPILVAEVRGKLPRATVERAGPGSDGPGAAPERDDPPGPSTGEGRLLVVADSDFPRDRFAASGPAGVPLLLDLVDVALDRTRLGPVLARQGARPIGPARFLGQRGEAAIRAVWTWNLVVVPVTVLSLGLGLGAAARAARQRRASRARDAAGQAVAARLQAKP